MGFRVYINVVAILQCIFVSQREKERDGDGDGERERE